MYTNSPENEMEFLVTLSKSSQSLKAGEKIHVTTCPCCKKGTVVTHHSVQHSQAKFLHYCDSCGEKFDISKLKAELFFNNQCWELKKLETPLGNIIVTVNDSPTRFRYLVSIHNDLVHKKSFVLHKIELNLSKFKNNDIIRCSFPLPRFQYEIKNNILICSSENKDYFFAMCTNPNYCNVDEHGMKLNLTLPSDKKVLITTICLPKKQFSDFNSFLASVSSIWRK
ncbi:MAG: hypothetical protein J6Y29_03255 [Clostridiales bacterium]|nr:hypothetical protein [Clostridiales bacterium]